MASSLVPPFDSDLPGSLRALRLYPFLTRCASPKVLADNVAADVPGSINGEYRHGANSVSNNTRPNDEDDDELSDLDTDEGNLAEGLERELAGIESPETPSGDESASDLQAEESESSEEDEDEDEDFLPQKTKPKPSRPKQIVDPDNSSDSEYGGVKARKRPSAVRREIIRKNKIRLLICPSC